MRINDNLRYHRQEKPGSMIGELTFSMIYTVNHDQVESGNSYGIEICDNLVPRLPDYGSREVLHIGEIGPGMGLSTVDFLLQLRKHHGKRFRLTAMEPSPRLRGSSDINRLGQYLTGMGFEPAEVNYVENDASQLAEVLEGDPVDILIANEVAGDLVTIYDLPRSTVFQNGESGESSQDKWITELRRMVNEYGLDVPELPLLAFNVETMKLVEDSYRVIKDGGILFVSEYSCEQEVPRYYMGDKIYQPPPGQPAPIRLGRGADVHTEYSVRFSDLKRVAESVGFRTERGKLVDLIGLKEGSKVMPIVLLENLLDTTGRLSDFFDSLGQKGGIPSQFSNNPTFLTLYLEGHPEVVGKVLGYDEREYDFHVGSRTFESRRFHGQFEYIIGQK